MSYTPVAGGLPARLCAWFKANRDEELTRSTRYDEVFKALKPNHSVAIPREYLHALAKAIQVRTKHHGGKYVVRVINDTEARLWRTA